MAPSHYLKQYWWIICDPVTIIWRQFHKKHLSHKSLKLASKNNLSKNFIQTSLGSKSYYSLWFGTIQTFHNSCSNVPWLTDWLIDWSLFPLIQTRSTIIWTYNMKQKLWKTMWIRVTQITQWNRNRTKGLFVFAGHVFIRIQWLYIHNMHSNMTTQIDMLMGIYIHSHVHIPMCTSIWIPLCRFIWSNTDAVCYFEISNL